MQVHSHFFSLSCILGNAWYSSKNFDMKVGAGLVKCNLELLKWLNWLFQKVFCTKYLKIGGKVVFRCMIFYCICVRHMASGKLPLTWNHFQKQTSWKLKIECWYKLHLEKDNLIWNLIPISGTKTALDTSL